jgi:pimeloyl-ACP methyl ester carboxylesterase
LSRPLNGFWSPKAIKGIRAMRLTILLLAATIVSACGGGTVAFGASSEGADDVPRFEYAPIPADFAPKTGDVEFGYLIVPENRRNPAGGRTVKLPVMIGKCRGEEPRPDPIIFAVGGPGVRSVMYAGRDLDRWPFLEERDFIYFEQRGAANADPSLVDAAIDSIYAAATSRLNVQPDSAAVVEAARRMMKRFADEGIDLTAYGTSESAADIEDLRRALGIEQWNLWGVSYSCKLMLEVVRRYPQGVRAIILDSPLPPDVAWDESSISNYWRNMRKLFAACREDSSLNSQYPDLERRFLALMDAANRTPLTARIKDPHTGRLVDASLNGEGVFRAVAAYMENPNYVSSFPHHLNLFCRRDSAAVSFFTGMLAEPPYAWGMRYSIWCNEEFPFEDSDRFDSHSDLPAPLRDLSWTIVPPEVCAFWPHRAVDPLDNQPVVSAVPALVTSGQYDPDTPPEWGRQVAETLSNAFYFEFPGQTHLPLFVHPCGKAMALEFLDDPKQRPEDSCLRRTRFQFWGGR